jgi:prepilin peptidase CpaA
MSVDVFLFIYLGSILVLAAFQDLRFHKIPNLLTYPTMCGAVVYHFVTNGSEGVLLSTGGLVLGIAILIVPYLMGGMGAGDVKLMGAVGAVLGPKGVFIALIFAGILGGIYALAVLFLNRQYAKGLISGFATSVKAFVVTGHFICVSDPDEKKKPQLCYGVVIAGGTFIYMFLGLLGHMWVT